MQISEPTGGKPMKGKSTSGKQTIEQQLLGELGSDIDDDDLEVSKKTYVTNSFSLNLPGSSNGLPVVQWWSVCPGLGSSILIETGPLSGHYKYRPMMRYFSSATDCQ